MSASESSGPPASGDPRPEPPEKPLPSECCEGGCDPCVFDLWAEAQAHYEDELARWEARRRGRPLTASGDADEG